MVGRSCDPSEVQARTTSLKPRNPFLLADKSRGSEGVRARIQGYVSKNIPPKKNIPWGMFLKNIKKTASPRQLIARQPVPDS